MHKLSQIDRSEVALGGNMRLGLTCIIDNLLWARFVVVLVVHVRYGVLDIKRYVRMHKKEQSQMYLIRIFQSFPFQLESRRD